MKDKTKRSLSSAAFLCAAVAAILLLNIVVNAAADKIRMRWDLTENGLYSLTKETESVLSSLNTDISLYYFVSAGQEIPQIEQVLDMYRTASPKLKIEKRDPNTDPVAARRFTDKGIAVQQNTIVLERGERYRAILPSEIYQSYTTQSGETLNQAFFGLEQLITRAIAYVSSDENKMILFTTGHNELDYSAAYKTVQEENIEAYQIDLKTEPLPDSADALYILGPAEDFTEDELMKIDAFLAAGKGVQICFDARKPVLPRLEQYLSEFWGVTAYHDLVCEGDASRTLNYAYMFVPDINENTITSDIKAGNQSTVFMYTRSLSVSDAENVTATPVATSSASAFSVHGSDKNVTEHIRDGAMLLAASLTRREQNGNEGRLFVSGSFQIYDAFFLEESALANRTLLYGATRFLTHDDSAALSISPKSMLIRALLISDGLSTFYIILISVIPPLLFFVAGFITFRRRRHL